MIIINITLLSGLESVTYWHKYWMQIAHMFTPIDHILSGHANISAYICLNLWYRVYLVKQMIMILHHHSLYNIIVEFVHAFDIFRLMDFCTWKCSMSMGMRNKIKIAHWAYEYNWHGFWGKAISVHLHP